MHSGSFIPHNINDQTNNNTKLSIIQSTCLFNKKLKNKNNCIDGTNIIYLAGSTIVYLNVFQNYKKFVYRISDSQVLGIAYLKANTNTVVLATTNHKIYNNLAENKEEIKQKQIKNAQKDQNQNNNQIKNKEQTNFKINKKLVIEIYTLGQKGKILAQLNQNVQFIDIQFIQRNKVLLLAKQSQVYYFYILQQLQRPHRKEVNLLNPHKFINQDQHIYLIGQKGMKLFQTQFQSLYRQIKFVQHKIQDFINVDSQFDVILEENILYCYRENILLDVWDVNKEEKGVRVSGSEEKYQKMEVNTLAKIGKNVLVSHANSITLSHLIIQKSKFKFLNNYTYKDKIKGGILSMQVSFDQMHLIMAVQTIQKEIPKIQNFMFNLSILSSQKKFINPFIRLVTLGTQNGQISNFQGLITFDTFYLVGNTIVNYNYNEQVQKKFKFTLHQTPKHISVHPLGYQMICIYDAQIKFYLKIQNQLVQIWSQQIVCSYAKYLSYGLVLLSCLQENAYQLILFDTNSYRRIRSIPNISIKHPINKIELDHKDSQVTLYSDKGLSIYKLKTGQKISEFKQKKQKVEIGCMSYNAVWKLLLVFTKDKTLLCYRKIDQLGIDFKLQKTIYFNQTIAYIQINNLIDTVFMGTISGKILWTDYPFNLVQKQGLKYLNQLQTQQLYLSSNKIKEIFITKNVKYLFVSFQNQGMNIFKLQKNIKYNKANKNNITNNNNNNTNDNQTRFNQFDISNLNFLQISSKTALEFGYEKLKVLLQKRKTVFNDLQQYKKQFQLKKNQMIKLMNKQNKQKQLNHVNQSLKQVQRLKKQKVFCIEQIKKLKQEQQKFIKQQEDKYQKQIIQYYDQNMQLKCKKQRVLKKCHNQFTSIQQKCQQNLNDIANQLKLNYQNFIADYQQMKNNLNLYRKRLQIQKQQAQEILLQILKNKKQKLTQQEIIENKKSNQYKAQITKYKKQCERFISRKFLLQSKKTYFNQQFIYLHHQRQQLNSIKKQLEQQLSQLELITNKKQKRLKKYFKENQILSKYQQIHNSLIKDLNGQVNFMNEQREITSKNILSLQKELSDVSGLNEIYVEKIRKYEKEIQNSKNKKVINSQKLRYLKYIIDQLSQAIQKTKINLNQQNKANIFASIYKDFYITKKLQKIIKSSQNLQPTQQQHQMQYKLFNSSDNKKKILNNIKQHKQYLQRNMKLFQKHNKKTDQQMDLNFLKYQTQNYNLIAECNIKKEQTNKKKRILHELIDSVKETQLYMNELQKENFQVEENKNIEGMVKSASLKRSSQSIPFIAYKKNKQQQEKRFIRKQESQPILSGPNHRKSGYQVRKMLDIQKMQNRPFSQNKLQRKIKTAKIKNRGFQQGTVHVQSAQFIQAMPDKNQRPQSVNVWRKPLTANGKRHQMPFGQYYNYQRVANKSHSKPTTCTTHTNNKTIHNKITNLY